MEVNFKFEIGEIVKHKLSKDMKFMILERHIQECIGGTQIRYLVRTALMRYGDAAVAVSENNILNEMELEKLIEKKE